MENIEFSWTFEALPFIYKELDTPDNGIDIPNALPYELTVDPLNGVLTQTPNKLVGEMLDKAYAHGSIIPGVIDEDNESLPYSDDFIDFFKESVNIDHSHVLKVLEIGSGTGFLLSQIKNLGFDVLGVEPGQHCLSAKEKYGVDIVHDFFPTQHIQTQFDIIIMTNVLEHIPNPSHFLKSLHGYLKEDGKLIISVPDEEPFITSGDISTLFHEHYSYFTRDTINYALMCGGFNPIGSKFGKYGGVLFRAATKDETAATQDIHKGFEIAQNYKAKSIIYNAKLKNFLLLIKDENKSLGVYVPSRFINLLYVSQIKDLHIRFFDDNQSMKSKYYPGFNIPIENKEDLISTPVDVLLIFSKAFGNKIKHNISGVIDPNTKIVTWEELFDC